jgi:hypothetical protein
MKKIIALILAAVMLAACTANNESPQTTETPETTATAITTTAETPAVTTTTEATTTTTTTATTTATTTTAEETTELTTEETTEATTAFTPVYDPAELTELLRENFPRIDGSTSTIPMDVAIRQAILGEDYFTATANTLHSTTYGSLMNMVSDQQMAERAERYIQAGLPVDTMNDDSFMPPEYRSRQADVLLSVDYDKTILRETLSNYNVELVKIPVAKEALVFLVNKANPIESISSEDIKKIYSGEITNWKELGGEDAEIKAFQRNADSGSQTAMVKFMGRTQLTAAETRMVVSAMGPLVDEVADYDSGVDSIGYSVFSFAAKQYANTENIKFIAVDDVPPTDQTIGDGSYPIIDYTYVHYNKNNEESTKAGQMLAQWLLSDEGQEVIRGANYINMNGDPPPQSNIKLFGESGTGKAKPADFTLPTAGYVLNPLTRFNNYIPEYDSVVTYGPYITINSDAAEVYSDPTFEENKSRYVNRQYTVRKVYPELNGLANGEAQSKINAEMKRMVREIEESNFYYTGSINYVVLKKDEFGERTGDLYLTAINAEYRIMNGYFSVLFYHSNFADYQSAVFDLRTGEKLNFTDLFYEGEDFIDKVNQAVNNGIQAGTFGQFTNPLKTPFVGLETGEFGFTLDKIIFYKTGAYYTMNTAVPVTFPYDCFAPALPDKMTDALNPGAEESYTVSLYGVAAADWRKLPEDEYIRYTLFGKNVNIEEDKRGALNALIEDFARNDVIEELGRIMPKNWLTERETLNEWQKEIQVAAVYYPGIALALSFIHNWQFSGTITKLFDPDTLEPMDLDDVLAEGWENAAQWTDENGEIITVNRNKMVDESRAHSFGIGNYQQSVVVDERNRFVPTDRAVATLTFYDGDERQSASVPIEFLKNLRID